MTREARWLVLFLCLLLAAFVAEHIVLFVLNDRHPLTLDACPAPRRTP